MTYDPSMNLKICTSRCRVCGDKAVGTELLSGDGTADFVCANCDRANFEIAAESQKDSWLAGSKQEAL